METNERKKPGLIVLVVILILMVLGLGGYIVYEKFFEKEEAKEEIKEVETDVEISVDSDEVKSINFLSTPFELTTGPFMWDASPIFDVGSTSNKTLLYMAGKITDFPTDYTETEDHYYLASENLYKAFKSLFGPDMEYVPTNIERPSCVGTINTTVYNATSDGFNFDQLGCGVEGYISILHYDRVKATKNGDYITLYMYAYKVDEVTEEEALSSDGVYTSAFCIITTDGVEVYNSQTSGCNSTIIAGLKAEGKIKTYKATFKKQSDGNYYITKGEWQ